MYLFIINGLRGGGAERVVQVLANQFASSGKKVTILTLENPQSDYPLHSSIQVHQVFAVPEWTFLRDLLLPLQLVALCLWLARLRPEFSLSLLARSNFLNVLACRLTRRSVCAISEHCESTEEFAPGTIYNWLAITAIRALYPKADHIFCVCQGIRECLWAIGVRHPKMHVVPNPVDLMEALDSSARHRPGRRTRIITVGRLVAAKDHRTLILAFQTVAEALNLELVIVGVGPMRAELDNMVASLGLEDRVRFTGWSGRVFEEMSQAELFVLSSLREGFGNVLIEAMACGLPVISTDCESGPREILAGGEYGFLTPVGDSAALAEAIRTIFTDRATRERFRERSRQRAQDYSAERIAAIYEAHLFAG